MNNQYRFWIPHRESYAKIIVTKNRAIEVTEGGETDEGYCRRWDRYFINDHGVLLCETHISSRDCDGRYESSQLSAWDGQTTHPAFIAQGPWVEGEGFDNVFDQSIQLLDWDNVSNSQRDLAAEEMGY